MTNRSVLTDVVLDTSGDAIQGAKVYFFAEGTGVIASEPTAPHGTAISGSFYAANSGGVALTNPITTDIHGRWRAYFDTAQRVDVGVSDNNHTAVIAGTSTPVNLAQTVTSYEVLPPFDNAAVPTVTAAGDHDYRIEWNGSLATAKNIRSGVTHGSNADFGLVLNSVMATASKFGPAGSQNLGTPSASIQLLNTNTTNSSVAISSTNWIGKPILAATDGVGNGGTTFTSASGTWTTSRADAVTGVSTSDVGRLIYIKDGGGVGTDLHTTITAVGGLTSVTLADACANSGSLAYTMPITIGMKLFGQGGGTRGQGNGHPDDGGFFLQATGTQANWNGKAVVDFRNAPSWVTQGFGSEFFEIHHLSIDANSLADYALVGLGVGTGNAAKCFDYTVQGATVANVGLAGNYFDAAASSDVFHDFWMSGKPWAGANFNWNGGGLTLPQGTVTTDATITGMPTNGGYLELFTTDKGRQLVHYTGITGATFTGCIGGTGTMRNGSNNIRYFPYGANICQGDVYSVDNYNIATNAHAMLVAQNAVTGQCFLGRGHMGGGSGNGPVVTVAYGLRGHIGRGVYLDNIRGFSFNDGHGSITYSTPGVWVVPMTGVAGGATSQWTIDCSQYNIQEANGYPIGFDGANIGGATQAGFGYFVGGTTNGKAAMVNGFVTFLNGWPSGTGLTLDHISATQIPSLYSNDAASTAVPDIIGTDISIATGASFNTYIPQPFKMAQGTTANRPAVGVSGEGGLFYNTSLRLFQQDDGTTWRGIQADFYTDGGNISGGTLTPDMKTGTYQKYTKTVTGTFTIVAASNAIAGQQLIIEIKNSSGGAFAGTGFDPASYTFPTAVAYPANTFSKIWTFIFNGTTWVNTSQSASY
jgi:hypothetical protein